MANVLPYQIFHDMLHNLVVVCAYLCYAPLSLPTLRLLKANLGLVGPTRCIVRRKASSHSYRALRHDADSAFWKDREGYLH